MDTGESLKLMLEMINRPISRRTDPKTSHQAAEKHTVLGKRAVRQQQVLDLVRHYPGKTSGELSRLMIASHPELPVGVAVASPHKRLSDLLRKNLVYKGRERKCTDSQYDACEWWPVR